MRKAPRQHAKRRWQDLNALDRSVFWRCRRRRAVSGWRGNHGEPRISYGCFFAVPLTCRRQAGDRNHQGERGGESNRRRQDSTSD
ncbi:hypothetical protein C4K17_3169 [Pseudomonas chlororaphis subsp. aurantiaca]|nr:hypothetical protein C4K17_3169 [Pseudomonas chlororaphis subsp. aurantiaca]